jgi:hypothetical protein
MNQHRPTHRWEDAAIVFMVMMMAVIIYLLDE